MITVFLIAAVGTAVAFALWWRDISEPQIALLGSGNRLSLLVMDGPARLVIASGDDAIGYENALTSVLPLFARRVDLLMIAGQDAQLLVPVAATGDSHVRSRFALSALTTSPESAALGPLPVLEGANRVRLGPQLTVTIETALPYGADPARTAPAWRATIERGESRVVVLSDGGAAALFPLLPRASVLIVAGGDPEAAWEGTTADVLVANAGIIDGPDLRASFDQMPHPPRWTYRLASGEALRLRFVDDGIALPSEPAVPVSATPHSALADGRVLRASP